MASVRENENKGRVVVKGLELTQTMADTYNTILDNFKGVKFTAKEVREKLNQQGKNYNDKQIIASVARLESTYEVLNKYIPNTSTTYEIIDTKETENE